QVVSITCDNTSSNNAMVRELETLLLDFLGEMDQTQCFAHIINLVAKSLLKIFN
ncbi:hypothetical protein BT96DRAFT_751877, partial [Gymnopus androsaceus JB14]